MSGIGEELADNLSYILEIANIFKINLEKPFREKWKINEEREWE